MYDQIFGKVYDAHVFGEFGEVNPSVTDSSTFTFMEPETMKELFSHEIEGCFLYSRHWNPTNRNLAKALAIMEDTESAQVTSSGMGAISCALLQLCGAGDEIVSSRTIYGGTYALMKNVLPRFGVKVHFVDIDDLEAVKAKLNQRTKVLYCESLSNPLLEVADIPALSQLAKEAGAVLAVDNTFSPLMFSPARLGADIVIHSLTKFINGASDCVAGAVCGSDALIHQLTDVNSGMCMLLGPVLDSYRSASIWKNLHTLHIRIKRHSENAMFVAKWLSELGLGVHYPGLPDHPHHKRLQRLSNPDFGYGGMLTLDAGDEAAADRLMRRMQEEKAGLLAVSLGYFRTLFSAPSHSTSSEIPEDEQARMGLGPGLIRMSIGLEPHIGELFERIKGCLAEVGLLRKKAIEPRAASSLKGR